MDFWTLVMRLPPFIIFSKYCLTLGKSQSVFLWDKIRKQKFRIATF